MVATIPTQHDERRRPTAWFLAVLAEGYDHPAFQTGHHVYVKYSGPNRYLVLGKGGVPLIMTEFIAARRLKRVRENSELVRVARQEYQSHRFWENLNEYRSKKTTELVEA